MVNIKCENCGPFVPHEFDRKEVVFWNQFDPLDGRVLRTVMTEKFQAHIYACQTCGRKRIYGNESEEVQGKGVSGV